MGWRSVTEDDLCASMTTQEIAVFRKSGGWKYDPVTQIIDRTVAMVRGYIRTNGKAVLSPNANEIPESCIAHAMNYAAYDLSLRWGGRTNKGREVARKDALDFFKSISRRWITPESYGEPESEAGCGPSTQIVGKSEEHLKIEDLKGL